MLGMNSNILFYNLDSDKFQNILKKEMAVKDMFKDYKDRLLICDEQDRLRMLELGEFNKDIPYQCTRSTNQISTTRCSSA